MKRKYLTNIFNERVLCKTCKKKITDKDNIEFCSQTGDYFCCLDCAIDFYVNYMESRRLTFDEATSKLNGGEKV